MAERDFVRRASSSTVVGTWAVLGSSAAVDVIAKSGMDFVILDLEHGSVGGETLLHMVLAAEASGCAPIVRLPEPDSVEVLRALEMGPAGVLVSHVDSAEMGRQLVEATRYPPVGNRGLSPYTRVHGYSPNDLGKKLEAANRELFVGVIVEGQNGLEELDEICEIDGLDMVYLGVVDLSMMVGAPGQTSHPAVQQLCLECVETIHRHGRLAGSVAFTPAEMAFLHEAGFDFIAYGVDVDFLRAGCADVLDEYARQESEEE